MSKQNDSERVLLEGANWKELHFYQKSVALFQMTFVFCDRFLPKHGDRTVDQMIQAARSGKQNIIEGSEDGKTSTEMELRLLQQWCKSSAENKLAWFMPRRRPLSATNVANVARSSTQELREDYKDYLLTRKFALWDKEHPRYAKMRDFTRAHNMLEDYEPYFTRWTAEEMANIGYTLCCQIDVMMNGYLATLEERFRKEGGIKERMHRVRTGYRAEQDRKMREMETTIRWQEERIKQLEAELKRMKEDNRG